MSEYTVKLCMWFHGIAALIVGVLIIIGGVERWGASTYLYLVQVPGAPEIWGVFILLIGVVIIAGAVRTEVYGKCMLNVYGLTAMMIWLMLFASGIVMAAVVTSASPVGAVWLVLTAFNAMVLAANYRENFVEKERENELA